MDEIEEPRWERPDGAGDLMRTERKEAAGEVGAGPMRADTKAGEGAYTFVYGA